MINKVFVIMNIDKEQHISIELKWGPYPPFVHERKHMWILEVFEFPSWLSGLRALVCKKIV